MSLLAAHCPGLQMHPDRIRKDPPWEDAGFALDGFGPDKGHVSGPKIRVARNHGA